MRLICIADTHGYHDRLKVPEGDVLVHAGDFTRQSTIYDIADFMAWFAGANNRHPVKILVAGNHDMLFQTHPELVAPLIPEGVTYLQDSGCQIDGLRIWGSPVQPRFHDWAFNRERGTEIKKHWDMIPDTTDVLITHGPASGILDQAPDGVEAGCIDLRRRIEALKLKAHICGHIHNGFGRSSLGSTIMVNASICDESYRPVRAPIVLDL